MVVLYFADIFGKPGRRAIRSALPDLTSKYQPDLIIGNAENLSGGRGVNKKSMEEMLSMGFHGLTSGNHIWDNKEVYSIFETDDRLIRPANFPDPENDRCPGRGFAVFGSGEHKIFVINLMGRIFMDAMDCPFRAVDKILKENPTDLPILVDMHGDATSEKNAMGWHLAGRVSAVVGSHSHVQTADERILPGGTAYITDVGMTGAFDSVIGLTHIPIVRKFMTKRPQHTSVAKENPGISCVIIEIGPNNRALSIQRERYTVETEELGSDRELD